jgi:hypothetical protein
MRLTFKALDGRTIQEIDGDAFALDHSKLETWPGKQPVARHVANRWEISGRTFTRFDCAPQVLCVFDADDKAGETQGPFESLTCVDGVVWAGSDAVAALKNNQWSSMFTRQTWPVVRLVTLA